jgi:ATP-dependent DNA helicase RecG
VNYVRIFTNHIEYYNPGGLPKPLEELKGKDLSIPRNPILAKLFRMVKLAENAGYGLDNIEHNWKEYNGTTVNYFIDFDSTIVKFENQFKINEGISEGISEVISERFEKTFGRLGKEILLTYKIIEVNPMFSAEQIASEIGKSSRTVENHLQKLKDAGLIERKGPKFGDIGS